MKREASAKTEHRVAFEYLGWEMAPVGWELICMCGWSKRFLQTLHEAEQAAIEHVEESK